MKGTARIKTTQTQTEETEDLTSDVPQAESESTWTVDQGSASADSTDATKGAKDTKGAPRESVHIREIRAAEDSSLKDFLDQLGTEGSYKIAVHRVAPEEWDDPKTGVRVQTKGLLRNYDRAIDEDFIAKAHGGGKYVLRILCKNAKGSYKFFTQRTIEVAGDPRVDDVHRTRPQPQAPATAAAGENPGIVREAFSVLKDQLERANERPAPTQPRIDPAVQLVLEQNREDMRRRDEQHAKEMERRDRENTELRREISELRDRKPAEDPIKEKLLGSLIDGESGRISGLRLQHESEIRQLRDNHAEELRRRDDRYERDVAAVRSGYEREIAALKTSYELAAASAKQATDTSIKLLERDIARLERDIDRLTRENTDLRGRKDKSIIEQAKEFEAIKDALNLDDGSDKTAVDKVVEVISSPAVGEIAQRIFGGSPPAVAQQVVAAQQPRVQARPRVVKTPDGQTFLAVPGPDGQVQLRPAKKKPKVIPATTNPDGTVATPEIQLPQVDPASVAMVVRYLESAYASNQDPEIVAQSQRSSVPEEILSWLRQHDTESVSGIDLFLAKVANLPSSSPLATQRGKNWIRRVGKALVGD